jgi:hypothetical protein
MTILAPMSSGTSRMKVNECLGCIGLVRVYHEFWKGSSSPPACGIAERREGLRNFLCRGCPETDGNLQDFFLLFGIF